MALSVVGGGCGADPLPKPEPNPSTGGELSNTGGHIDATGGGVTGTGGLGSVAGHLVTGTGGSLSDPDAGLTDKNACGASSVTAEVVTVEQEVQVEVEVEVEVPYEVQTPAPVALYILLDHSISMKIAGLWAPAVSAVQGFLNDEASAGVDVALQYFPISGGSCSDGAGYDTPTMEIGRLPGILSALTGSLTSADADGYGTPLEGALRGATEYCKQFESDNPSEDCIAVVVTDGKPELAIGCSESHGALANIARAAYDDFGIRTFTVGLQGADFDLLDDIAEAGGATDCDTESDRFACDVSGNADMLTVALAKIRDTVTTIETRTEVQLETKTEIRTTTMTQALECTWQVPNAQGDAALDIHKVNVELLGQGAAKLGLGRVADANACADRGWYYDDPGTPSRIVACPQTCDRIKDGSYVGVDILLGCETESLLE